MAPLHLQVVKLDLSSRTAEWIVGSAALAFLILWHVPIALLNLGLKTCDPPASALRTLKLEGFYASNYRQSLQRHPEGQSR